MLASDRKPMRGEFEIFLLGFASPTSRKKLIKGQSLPAPRADDATDVTSGGAFMARGVVPFLARPPS